MSNLQLIEELCYIVERQIKLIRTLSDRLLELNGLTEAEHEAVAGVEAACARTIGEEAGLTKRPEGEEDGSR